MNDNWDSMINRLKAFFHWFGNLFITNEPHKYITRSDYDLLLDHIEEPFWDRLRVFRLPGSRVARKRFYEMRERYFTLAWYVYRYANYFDEDAFNEEKKARRDAIEQDIKENLDVKDLDLIFRNISCQEQYEKKLLLQDCARILISVRKKLNRKENSVNFVWRELSRVHSFLISHIFPQQRLAKQKHILTEDTHRLGIYADPVITERIKSLSETLERFNNDLYENTGSTGENGDGRDQESFTKKFKADIFVRDTRIQLTTLVDTINRHRISIITNQCLNVRAYSYTWFACTIASILMLVFPHDIFMARIDVGPNGTKSVDWNLKRIEARNDLTEYHDTYYQTTEVTVDPENVQEVGQTPPLDNDVASIEAPPSFVSEIIDVIRSIPTYVSGGVPTMARTVIDIYIWNPLILVFFAGYLGGLLSVATRIRNKPLDSNKGDFVSLYMVTQPLIGALSAMCFKLLLDAGVITLDFTNKKDLFVVRDFAIGFIAGFSERLVFPTLQQQGNKD